MYHMQEKNLALVHIRFDGRSWDVSFDTLGVTARASDAEMRAALAHYLEVSDERLRFYVLERHLNGNMTLRPEAVFG